MIKIDIRPGLAAFRRDFDNFATKQLPFATARALTETARKAAAVETQALSQTLDRPTPFTLRGPTVQSAGKSNLTAVLDMRPIQAAYLAPEEFGEPQKVAKTAVVVPVDAALNSYGNLPPKALLRYKGRKDVFVGRITVNGRTIGGVWQRIAPAKGKAKGRLKLLLTFEAPVVPRTRLGWHDRAAQSITATIGPEMDLQMGLALKSARR